MRRRGPDLRDSRVQLSPWGKSNLGRLRDTHLYVAGVPQSCAYRDVYYHFERFGEVDFVCRLPFSTATAGGAACYRVDFRTPEGASLAHGSEDKIATCDHGNLPSYTTRLLARISDFAFEPAAEQHWQKLDGAPPQSTTSDAGSAKGEGAGPAVHPLDGMIDGCTMNAVLHENVLSSKSTQKKVTKSAGKVRRDLPLPEGKCVMVTAVMNGGLPVQAGGSRCGYVKQAAVELGDFLQVAWPVEAYASSGVRVFFKTMSAAEATKRHLEGVGMRVDPVRTVSCDDLVIAEPESSANRSVYQRATRTLLIELAASCKSDELPRIFKDFQDSVTRQWTVTCAKRGARRPLGMVKFNSVAAAIKAQKALHGKRALGLSLNITFGATAARSKTLWVTQGGKALPDEAYSALFKPAAVMVKNHGADGAEVTFDRIESAVEAQATVSRGTYDPDGKRVAEETTAIFYDAQPKWPTGSVAPNRSKARESPPRDGRNPDKSTGRNVDQDRWGLPNRGLGECSIGERNREQLDRDGRRDVPPPPRGNGPRSREDFPPLRRNGPGPRDRPLNDRLPATRPLGGPRDAGHRDVDIRGRDGHWQPREVSVSRNRDTVDLRDRGRGRDGPAPDREQRGRGREFSGSRLSPPRGMVDFPTQSGRDFDTFHDGPVRGRNDRDSLTTRDMSSSRDRDERRGPRERDSPLATGRSLGSEYVSRGDREGVSWDRWTANTGRRLDETELDRNRGPDTDIGSRYGQDHRDLSQRDALSREMPGRRDRRPWSTEDRPWSTDERVDRHEPPSPRTTRPWSSHDSNMLFDQRQQLDSVHARQEWEPHQRDGRSNQLDRPEQSPAEPDWHPQSDRMFQAEQSPQRRGNTNHNSVDRLHENGSGNFYDEPSDLKRPWSTDRREELDNFPRGMKRQRETVDGTSMHPMNDRHSSPAQPQSESLVVWDSLSGNQQCQLCLKGDAADVVLQPIAGDEKLWKLLRRKSHIRFRKRVRLRDLMNTLETVGSRLTDVCTVASVTSTGNNLHTIEENFTQYLKTKDAALVVEDGEWTYFFVPPAIDGAAGKLLRQFSIPLATYTTPLYAAPILIAGHFVLKH